MNLILKFDQRLLIALRYFDNHIYQEGFQFISEDQKKRTETFYRFKDIHLNKNF